MEIIQSFSLSVTSDTRSKLKASQTFFMQCNTSAIFNLSNWKFQLEIT